VPGMHTTAQYSWFIGMGLGLVTYLGLAARFRVASSSRVTAAVPMPVPEPA